jgi:hypothetical protein
MTYAHVLTDDTGTLGLGAAVNVEVEINWLYERGTRYCRHSIEIEDITVSRVWSDAGLPVPLDAARLDAVLTWAEGEVESQHERIERRILQEGVA